MMRKSTTVQQWIAGSLICGALGVSACAPARPPVTSFSRTSITYLPPPEPVELRLAREELADARLAWNIREYDRAYRLTEQALANAQLAEARAVTESTRQTARDLRLTIETWRDEAARASAMYLAPPAPAELRLAREELADARLALDAREYERARLLAEQAMADARLAEARAVTESTRQAARDVRLSGEILRAEAARLVALY